MVLQQFPDLLWLKQQIDQRFQQRRAYGNIPLETDGFPNVIIHSCTKEVYRPDIVGPISLFLNLQGESHCKAEGRTVNIKPDYFFLTNRLQPYTLEIKSKEAVETFNIHIGEVFSEGVLGALMTPADVILNNGLQQKIQTVAFHNQLYRRDAVFNSLVEDLKKKGQPSQFNKGLFEESMAELLRYLLLQHRQLMQQINRLPPVKQSTKTEIHKRLAGALDYLPARHLRCLHD
jgi:AraC family transcriptional regulator